MEQLENIVILCIGTNKLIGDSVGPIVGQKLNRLLENKKNVTIYGDTKQNLNLKNIEKILQERVYTKSTSYIITIDAALGPKEMIEKVFISKGKIKIGEALGEGVEYFSDINIKGIVGEYQKGKKQNFDELNKVERKRIHRLSNQIAYRVCQIVEEVNSV